MIWQKLVKTDWRKVDCGKHSCWNKKQVSKPFLCTWFHLDLIKYCFLIQVNNFWIILGFLRLRLHLIYIHKNSLTIFPLHEINVYFCRLKFTKQCYIFVLILSQLNLPSHSLIKLQKYAYYQLLVYCSYLLCLAASNQISLWLKCFD